MKGSEVQAVKNHLLQVLQTSKCNKSLWKVGVRTERLLGRTCLLCSFFHLLQFPKNDAPLKVQVTPGHTSKNGPKTATSLHYSMPRNGALRLPADQGWNVAEYLPECQHLSVHQNSVRFRVQAFLCFARILLVSRHFCGIAYAGSSETQCFASNKWWTFKGSLPLRKSVLKHLA